MNVTRPKLAAPHLQHLTRLRLWLAAGWVAFLAASAALAPMVYLTDYLIDITGGDPRLPVWLGFYSLVFLSLWLCGLLACILLMILRPGEAANSEPTS